MKYDTLKALVNAKVYENTEQRITGGDMNTVLQSAIASLGAHYQMGGLVSPADQITVGDEPVVFLATTPGTYTYFGGIVVADGEVALLVWSGTAWSKQTPDIATGTEVSQLGQKMICPIEDEIKNYIINGTINESTGAIVPGSPWRLTTSMYLRKIHYGSILIDQTNSQVKYLFAAYKHRELGTPPEWIAYQSTDIIYIPVEDGYLYSLYIAAPGDVAISPSDLSDVIISYGFYDDSKRIWNEKIGKRICLFSDSVNVIDNDSGCFLDLGSDPGLMIDGEIYWFVYWYPNDSDAYRKINLCYLGSGESSLRAIIADTENHTISNVPYSYITNKNERHKGKYVIICTFWYTGVGKPNNIQYLNYTKNGGPAETSIATRKCYIIGSPTPNIVFNENDAYVDFGADPGLLIDGVVYWFAYWYPNNSDGYRKVDMKFDPQSGQSSSRAIIANLVNKTISNIPYHYITNDPTAYKDVVIIFTYDINGTTPGNIQGINYTINNGAGDLGESVLSFNPDIITKVANSARAFHLDETYVTVAAKPVNFLYFSDVHSDVIRTQRLFSFKNHISQYIDDVLFTGDSDNYPADTTWWNDYAKQMLIALGNHEYMVEFVEGAWQHETPQHVYEKFIAPYKSYWTGVVFPDNPETGKSYYYKDYADKNLRLIAMDYMEINLNPDSTQIAWLESVLNDVLTNYPAYHVVIAIHQCAFLAEQDYKNPFDSLDFPSDTDGVIPVGIPNAVQSFINSGGHFACYLTGHNHTDHFGLGINYPNQLNISIACACMDTAANVLDIQRVADTKSQDLFNIVSIDTYSSIIKMIRVGCDYDRQLRKKNTICFYYGNEEFDAQSNYRWGRIVIYQNKIYQFIRSYSGGGWNPSIVKEIERLIYVD